MYLLVPVSVVLVFLIAAIFWWSLRSGQFEDLEGPGYRILMDDDAPKTDSLINSTQGEQSAEISVQGYDVVQIVDTKVD